MLSLSLILFFAGLQSMVISKDICEEFPRNGFWFDYGLEVRNNDSVGYKWLIIHDSQTNSPMAWRVSVLNDTARVSRESEDLLSVHGLNITKKYVQSITLKSVGHPSVIPWTIYSYEKNARLFDTFRWTAGNQWQASTAVVPDVYLNTQPTRPLDRAIVYRRHSATADFEMVRQEQYGNVFQRDKSHSKNLYLNDNGVFTSTNKSDISIQQLETPVGVTAVFSVGNKLLIVSNYHNKTRYCLTDPQWIATYCTIHHFGDKKSDLVDCSAPLPSPQTPPPLPPTPSTLPSTTTTTPSPPTPSPRPTTLSSTTSTTPSTPLPTTVSTTTLSSTASHLITTSGTGFSLSTSSHTFSHLNQNRKSDISGKFLISDMDIVVHRFTIHYSNRCRYRSVLCI